MNHAKTRLGTFSRRTFEAGSLIILIALLALPFSKAFADDQRRGGPGFYGAVSVEGWRLGGGYRRDGGYEIYRWTRGGWIRVPGRGIQLGGSSRSPWVINTDGERYQWTGRGWRFVGYANGRAFNRRNPPPPVYRNYRDRDYWYDDRGRRDPWLDNRGNRRAPVIQQQRNRIERQQDRIQDLRRDLRRERSDNRQYERREERRDDRQGDRNRREDRNDNGRRGDRNGDRQ